MGISDLFKPNVEKMAAKKDVKGLIKALKYKEETYVRVGAAKALGNIGAVEPLIMALKDGYKYVPELAAEALGNIGDSRAVEPLIQSLKDEDRDVREAAKEALKKIKKS